MSWLNNSLNTIKGQLSTLAQEVLAETAGPGDDEYRGSLGQHEKSLLQQLNDTQAERDELVSICESLKLEVNKEARPQKSGAKIDSTVPFKLKLNCFLTSLLDY